MLQVSVNMTESLGKVGEEVPLTVHWFSFGKVFIPEQTSGCGECVV
jgi:hypothetical protein